MELNDLLLLSMLSMIVSAMMSVLICVITALILRTIRERDVETLYKDMESLEMSVRGRNGNEKKALKQEFVAEAEAKIGSMLLGGGIKKENIPELLPYISAIPDILAKYSKVVSKV